MVKEIKVDFVKRNNFFLYCILKYVKILFLFLCMDQIYVLNENCKDMIFYFVSLN